MGSLHSLHERTSSANQLARDLEQAKNETDARKEHARTLGRGATKYGLPLQLVSRPTDEVFHLPPLSEQELAA